MIGSPGEGDAVGKKAVHDLSSVSHSFTAPQVADGDPDVAITRYRETVDRYGTQSRFWS